MKKITTMQIKISGTLREKLIRKMCYQLSLIILIIHHQLGCKNIDVNMYISDTLTGWRSQIEYLNLANLSNFSHKKNC